MKIRLIIALVFLTSFANGQHSELHRKRIDKYRIDIDKRLKEQKLVSKKYPDRSFCGGSLTGYYLNDKLVLITADNSVAFSSHQLSYYIMLDTLVFVKEIIKRIKEPDDCNEYTAKHKDKDNTNLSKVPLEVDDYNVFYFHSDEIIYSEMKSFKKKINPHEDVTADKNKMILRYYGSHLDELGTLK